MTPMRTLTLLLALAVAACGHAPPPRMPTLPSRVLDLTYPYDANTIYWPTAPSGFQRETLSYGRTPSGYFYAAGKFDAPEHGGTHLDAPFHFAEHGATADVVPLARLSGPAVVIDISKKASKNPDALLEPGDITAFEKAHGKIDPGTIVLVRTGWGNRWPDKRRYLGDDTPGDASNLHFPGVSGAAAGELVARGVGAVGIDTASIDNGPSRDFAAHQAFAGAGVPILENVASLDKLPPRGALLVALPMKIAGGSGAPVRIAAFLLK